MAYYKVIIQGRGAKDAAEQLVKNAKLRGEVSSSSPHVEGTRDLDFHAIVEFFKAIEPLASSAEEWIALALTIWELRKTIGDKKVVKLQREINGEIQTLEVYPSTTQEEIEAFLLKKDTD